MIGLPSGILDGCENILAFEVRIVFQNCVKRRSGAQQFEHVADANPHAPNARATAALCDVDSNPVKAI